MAQVSWRADDELVARVRAAALGRGRSMNEYLTLLAEAATDPQNAGDEVARLRARLERAGLLAGSAETARRPPRAAVRAAAERAGRGTPLSDLVSNGR